MQQTAPCSNCGQPIPAGAAFCGNCGARRQASPQSDPTQRASAPPQSDPTQIASAPPAAGGDYAPTQMGTPPPPPPPYGGYGAPPAGPPGAPVNAPSGPNQPAFAAGTPPPMYPSGPPPVYTPGPPPVAAPGGGVQPWAQPPKKRRGRRVLGCLLALVLVVAVLGGGGFLLVKAFASKGGTTAQQGSSTPGASATAGSGSTATSGPNGQQSLNNINRVGIYAGVTFTVMSAIEAQKLPDDFSNGDPDHDNIIKIVVGVDYESSRHGGFIVTGRIMSPGGNPIERGIGHGVPKDEVPEIFGDPLKGTYAFYFEVPKTVKITDWTLLIGDDTQVVVAIPLSGNYDPTLYQEHPHTQGLNQPIKYDNGNITGVITKVITVTWNPCGCEAPKEMRFLRLYFHVTNNTALPVNVGDGIPPQYLLIYPNGDRLQADTQYNAPINAVVNGGESKDVGFDSWVIPSTPAPYTIVFLNPDGSKAGQIDLGTV